MVSYYIHKVVQPPPQSILEHTHHRKKRLYPLALTPHSPLSQHWATTNILSVPTDWFASSGRFIQMESHGMWLSVAGCFHSACCLQGSPTPSHVSELRFFLGLTTRHCMATAPLFTHSLSERTFELFHFSAIRTDGATNSHPQVLTAVEHSECNTDHV